ncbi:MAG: sigma-54 dependent transcriptional regulator [Acidobacteriota bacterium]|nr:sigma-54 dependent transcriptional regulator [Acidobacteriota bacterium]
MSITHRQLILCVSDVLSLSQFKSVAEELGIGLVLELSPATLLENKDLSQAGAIVIEFSEFGSEASLLMNSCREKAPEAPVIALLRDASSSDAVRFSRSGVFECLDTLSATNEIFNAVELAFAQVARNRAARLALSTEPWRRHLVGQSTPIEQVTKIIRLVASRRCTVLISGETGTGKEMAARAIHMASDRARRPMVSVNCSAIPENLIEAELFGHVKGAYTGAVNHRVGRFEQAQGGTIFLDEIADLPFDLQSKLLRVLQEKEIQRLGSSETVKIDVRVIAATNANLLKLVQQGRFREDLYYRLNVVPIRMPALRERMCDIAPLANHFVHKVCEAERMNVKEISSAALTALADYSWPGNVRQLENVIEHAVVMSGDRDKLYPSDFALPESAPAGPILSGSTSGPSVSTISVPAGRLPDEGLDFTEALRQFERAILQQALTRAQGNKTLAADMLRLPRTTLIHKLRVLDQAAA